MLGHSMHGFTRFILGELVAARTLLEQCNGMNDPERRAVYIAQTSADQYAVMLIYFSVTLMYLGQMDQARTRLKEALSAARQLGHAHTLAFVLTWASIVEQVARIPHAVRELSEEGVNLSSEHGFPIWSGAGMMIQGWAATEVTKGREGLDLITKGLSVYRATGAVLFTPFLLMLLAEAHAELGSRRWLDEAQQISETASEASPQTDESCRMPCT
jgi:predicted ATPase